MKKIVFAVGLSALASGPALAGSNMLADLTKGDPGLKKEATRQHVAGFLHMAPHLCPERLGSDARDAMRAVIRFTTAHNTFWEEPHKSGQLEYDLFLADRGGMFKPEAIEAYCREVVEIARVLN